MLSTFFGFGGRIGRLRYFVSSIALGIAMVFLVAFAFVGAITQSGGKGSGSVLSGFVPLLFIAPLFLWSSLALQAKRIRDIGWNPAMVIPAWMTISVFATMLTVFTGGKGGGLSMLGGMINLTMSIVLLAWPGDGNRDDGGAFGTYHAPEPLRYHEPPPLRQKPARVPGEDAPGLVPPRVRAASPPPRPVMAPPVRGPGGFGRRGLS